MSRLIGPAKRPLSTIFGIATALLLAGFAAYDVRAREVHSSGVAGRGTVGKDHLKNVYLGEEHLYTSDSFDAFTLGVAATSDDA